ncbi:MAG TPA: ABC transporter permease subunit [Pseudothermotoga sp.]
MFNKEFYDMKLRTFVILIIGVGLFFVLAPFQGITVEMLKQYSQMENVPKFLEKLMPKEFINNLSDWNFYIYSQWFGKNLGQMVPILAIIMAFPLFARETENGTIEFLLARKNRKKIFFSKSLLGILITIFLMAILSLLPAIYSPLAGEKLNYKILIAFLIHTLVGATFWFAITMFFSIISNDQVKPILISVGLLAITTAMGIIKFTRFLNTYAYVLGSKIFQTGHLDIKYTLGSIAISVIVFFLSYITFLRKEY